MDGGEVQDPLFWAVLVGLVLAVGSVVVIWNLLVSLRNDILRAWANVDVILQQRHDEIGNLVASVRDYMAYEQALLTEITESRARLLTAHSVREKSGLDQRLRQGVNRLYAVIEAYPAVQANHLVLELMRRITALENALADRREMYNSTVTHYNTMLAVVPIVFISRPLGFQEEMLFIAESAARSTHQIQLRG